MSSEVSIDYDLGQHGWSKFKLTVGSASTVVGTYSYCSDALGDLVRAALMIATSGWQTEVSFDGEPMEWRLVIGSYWDPSLASSTNKWTDFRLRVFTFPSITNPLTPISDGEKIFEASCTPDAFVTAVLNAAQFVWEKYGTDGYDKAWGGPTGFPLRALTALKAAVSVGEPRTTWVDPHS